MQARAGNVRDIIGLTPESPMASLVILIGNVGVSYQFFAVPPIPIGNRFNLSPLN